MRGRRWRFSIEYGRRRQVDDDLGARGDQRLDGIAAVEALGPEVGVVPDVLADRDAQPAAAKRERRHLGRRARSTATRRRRRRWAAATCAPRERRARRRSAPRCSRGRARARPGARGTRPGPRPSRRPARSPARPESRAKPRGTRAARADPWADTRRWPARGKRRARRPAPRPRRPLQNQPTVAVEVADRRIHLSQRELHVTFILQGGPAGPRVIKFRL